MGTVLKFTGVDELAEGEFPLDGVDQEGTNQV